jgi:hypothetical protein
MLSDDVFHDRAADVCPTEVVINVVGIVGGAVSGQAPVMKVTVEIVETFPTASVAATPATYFVAHDKPVIVYPVPEVAPTCAPSRKMT